MNDLSTSKPSGLQNTWSSLPWGEFLFLLAVFAFSSPLFRFATPGGGVTIHTTVDMANALRGGNWMRQVALISLGAVALFNLLRSKPSRFQINGLLGWLILFYLVWAVLSIIWSVDPRFTLKRVGILLFLSLGALYVAERFSFQEIIVLVFFICAVATFGGLFIVIRYHIFLPFNSWWRFGGNMHPIVQGWHCGLLLLSAFALSKTDEQNRIVYLCIAFMAFSLLVLTRSRMAFVSIIMGSAVYWGLTSKKRYQGVLFFLGIIIFGCSIYFLLGNRFIGFGENILSLGRGGGIGTVSNLTGRIPVWEVLLRAVNQRPFAGHGYDTYTSTAAYISFVTKEVGWMAASAHSGYIETLLGLGYIGAVPLVVILTLSVTMSISLAKRDSEYAFIAAVFVWLIFNLYTEDKVLTRPFFPVFVWMIMLARLGFIREKR